MSENFSDDVCRCIFCEARYIIYLGPIKISISDAIIQEFWFGENLFFNKLRNNVGNYKNYRGRMIKYDKI